MDPNYQPQAPQTSDYQQPAPTWTPPNPQPEPVAPTFTPQVSQSQPAHHIPGHHGNDHHQPQPAPHASQNPAPQTWASEPAAVPAIQPMPVVRVLSPIGVEYVFLTFTLFTGALGLASALVALFNGKTDFSVLAFPVASLVVSVPLFATIFLHLKKLELKQPSLKLDPSKRRSTQFTQILSFVVSLFTLIGLVFAIFAKIGGVSSVSIVKAILDALAVLLVSGGILAYYWHDEHQNR